MRVTKPQVRLVCASGADATASHERRVTRLTVNGLVEPMGIPVSEPAVFGWALEAVETGAAQKAWHLQVRDACGDVVWDAQGIGHKSQGITYQGTTLAPRSRYTWRVGVTDERGETIVSDEQVFSCGLADGTYAAWDMAQWIGADGLYFDAAVACHFFLEATVEIDRGSTRAGIVFGADDHRLANIAMNVWGSSARSRIVYEIDVANPRRPTLNIYVVGMPAYGRYNKGHDGGPDFTIDISSALPVVCAHRPIRICVNTSRGLNLLTCTVNGVTVDEGRRLNPLGGTQAHNTFPNLCKIGFSVPKGERATFRDVRVRYPGGYKDPYEVGDLFSATQGATYAIFEGIDGVSVVGDTITVEGVLAYADPSFGSAPMLRREFACRGTPSSATLYAAVQGIVELELNGRRVSEDFFDCGLDEYATDMPYRAFDVTNLVVPGDNALGAQLAEGWWSGHQSQRLVNWGYYGAKQALMALLDIRYADGTTTTVVTDARTWKVSSSGPVRAASNFHGERYDARIAAAMEGWSQPGFDDSGWEKPVEVIPRLNDFAFRPRLDAPAHAVGKLSCVACLGEARPASGAYIYDMGENVMGVPEIAFPAGYVEDGDLVTIRFAEALYPDREVYRQSGLVGLMMVENLRAALATDFYVARAGDQVFCPHFTFHGYRYLEISGLARPLPKDCVKTVRLSSIDVRATYEGSNELVNRFVRNVSNSQASNFFSIPTDCPQRSERLGWTGDAQVFCAAASLNADVYNFYRNWLFALRAVQNRDGSLPNYAPTFEPTKDGVAGIMHGISWDAALIHIPYTLWRETGDVRIVADNIDAMVRYLDYLAARPLLVPKGPTAGHAMRELTGQTGMLADWNAIEQTDCNLVNGAVYVYLLRIASEMAFALGRDDLAGTLDRRHVAARKKWNELYVDPICGKTRAPAHIGFNWASCTVGYQEAAEQDTETSYATPLALGVFSEANERRAAHHLAKAVRARGHTITSGFSGTPHLLPALTRHGYAEDAYRLFEQRGFASWLYPVAMGATSVWERWDSHIAGWGPGGGTIGSLNHFSFGAVLDWVIRDHLGIGHVGLGWQRLVIAPVFGGSFTWAKGSIETPYGTVSCAWEADGGKPRALRFTIPANTSAAVFVPAEASVVGPSTLPAGLRFAGMGKRNGVSCAVFEATSGTFEIRLA